MVNYNYPGFLANGLADFNLFVGLNFPSQSLTIAPTGLYPSAPPAGLYTVGMYLQTTVAAGVAQVQARIDWTDEAGATNFSSTQFLGQLGRTRNVQLIRCDGIVIPQFRATVTGVIGIARYQLSINVRPW